MKRTLPIVLVVISFISCDMILKPRENDSKNDSLKEKVVLGNDKDEKGCVTSAGYMWSSIKENCIRVFEEGYRLVPYKAIDDSSEEETELATLNAYIIFDNENNKAELFLPNSTTSILLVRESEGKPFIKEEWILEPWKGYVLKKNDEIIYVSAPAKEKKYTGSDTGE